MLLEPLPEGVVPEGCNPPCEGIGLVWPDVDTPVGLVSTEVGSTDI